MLQNPSHTYSSAGIYNVTLIASNAGGQNTSVKTGYITVSAPTPNAALIANTIPTAMDNYISYSVSVTVSNTGTMAWTHDDGFALTAVNNDARLFGNTPISLPVGTVVQPGQQYTFSFTMTAPAQYGNYTPQYRMIWNGQNWFGNTLSPSVNVANAYNATYVMDTIPATVTSYSSSRYVQVYIVMKNTGTKTWTTNGNNPVVEMASIARSDILVFSDSSTSGDTCAPGQNHYFYGTIDTYFNPGYANPVLQLNSGLAFGHFGPFVAKTIQYTSSGSSSAPRANFVASPVSGAPPLNVQFTDTSSNSPTSWQWNFGDGATSTAQNPSHTYTGTGLFTVTLTASNAQGSSSSSITINVHQGLSAGFVYSKGGLTNAPLNVYFTDVSTGPVTSWQWNFGDGATSTARNPTHTYTSAGTFTITLTVTDNANDMATDMATVTVNPTPTPASNPLSSYQYVKEHMISPSDDGILTNYQMKFVVHRGTGTDSGYYKDMWDYYPANGDDVYLNGHSLSWPNDIRFAATDTSSVPYKDVELPYWIESYDAETATIWVKIDRIASGKTIKMYYGKSNDPGASTALGSRVIANDPPRHWGWGDEYQVDQTPNWITRSATVICVSFFKPTSTTSWLPMLFVYDNVQYDTNSGYWYIVQPGQVRDGWSKYHPHVVMIYQWNS